MAVKVMIKRLIKEGNAKDVFVLLNKHRSNAMNQKGYITGETLMSYQNPLFLLVISTWQSIEKRMRRSWNSSWKLRLNMMNSFLGPILPQNKNSTR